MITNRILKGLKNPGLVIPYVRDKYAPIIAKTHKIGNSLLVIYLFGGVEIIGKLDTSYFLT